jgi:LytR cell envelope-related transcriptional attenuator
MTAPADGGNGSTDHGSGGSFEPPDRARAGLGVAIVIVAVVLGVLLLPSATRAPLAASASTSATTTIPTTGGSAHGHHHSSTTTTSTTVPASAIHVLVANATLTNGVAGAVTTFLASKGFATLTATNALLKATASEIFTVGGTTAAEVHAVAVALNLPATAIEPAATAAPVTSTTGANVVVIVGPDLATRFNPATTTTAAG